MTIHNFDERITKLSPASRALLELALKQKSFDAPAKQSIRRRQSNSTTPLSFAQQRLWFLNQLEPESRVYNQAKAIQLKGTLSVEALRKALDTIVNRHEVLRTTFCSPDGETPVQIIADSRPVDLTIVDLGSWEEDKREAALQRQITEIMEQPFDLSLDLMLRAALLKLGPSEHVLLLVTHHIASDAWSSEILWHELAALYEAFLTGKPDPLPELPIQYADYATWQSDWLTGEVLQTQVSYWKNQLSGIPILELPTDRPRSLVQSYRGSKQFVMFAKPLIDELKKLSRNEGATLFMTLLAAFQVLLYRYSGQEDIAVGCPIAGRTRSELERLIGFFVNTLVLRTDLSGNPSFTELLARVRAVALEAYEHQDLPFEKLVEELHPERDLSRNPLFQVAFALQNVPSETMRLPGMTVTPLDIKREVAKFDLCFALWEDINGLRGSLEYSTDLFDAATIERMLGHFETLLKGIVANPQRRIFELPILTEAERHQLLVEWNATETDYAKDTCVHQLFERQVGKSPNAVALVFENQQLTYQELNSKANQLAHYLRKVGVGPETLVAICLERSLEMIIGLLGILKAGGAYVPLDPVYPKQRLAFMLEDTKATVLLTQAQLIERLPEHSAHSIYLDRDREVIAQQSEENPNSKATSQNLAYVLYTSGSTGQPKGVAIEHRQLLNYLFGILDRLTLPAQSSFATVSTIAADLGNTVIFSSLCTGGSLHVISQDRIADADMMADYFSRHSIDCLKIVPSHLAALLTSSHPERVLPRRLLILGGEACSLDWVKTVRALAPSCLLLNHYGPTEATIGVLTYQVEPDSSPAQCFTVPLGRPIANTQIYLLDGNLKPVPVGVPGELHIAGSSLARGYLNRPELTAEKFVPNPFSLAPGARLYKTGDLARYLPDGNIEFLGRTDDQVKIRGYRIEPAEIEAILRQHPGVREVAVLGRDDSAGQRSLVAYVVPTQDRAPTVAGKQRYQLPNRAAVAQLNKNETDYVYQEIFERQAYLRHGITINDGDCIFDVGANIGLFMLFVNQVCKSPRVFGFEPNPEVFEILSTNACLYDLGAKLFNCGLSREAKSATFTFFAGFSLLSGFYADPQAEKQVVKTFMMNQQKAGLSGMTELVEQADTILEERFVPQTFSAQLRTLSSVIEEEKIDRIDLLKINVEKSELDVLLGIKGSDWQKIKQIVLEVDVKENLDTILSLLQKHGYHFAVEQDILLENTPLCYVYAIRPSTERMLDKGRRDAAHFRHIPVFSEPFLSAAELRGFLSAKLPDYMLPSALVFLDALPLTRNGKLDRRALPVPADSTPELNAAFVAPRTVTEQLIADIWAELLKLKQVGIHDNFFDLGGHSLLATRLISKIRSAFGLDLPLRVVFQAPTIAAMVAVITETQAKRLSEKDVTRILMELESLSDEEAQRLLSEEKQKRA